MGKETYPFLDDLENAHPRKVSRVVVRMEEPGLGGGGDGDGERKLLGQLGQDLVDEASYYYYSPITNPSRHPVAASSR